MYHKKKIALFISHIYGEYQSNLCQGVINQAAEYGYQTEVYSSNDGENWGGYGIGEESLLKIPNFQDIDGVVFASGTYVDFDFKKRISALLQQNKCPVVEISEYQPDFPFIALENNLTTGTLTEHLITAHGCKRICYLGCSREQFFSDRRQKAFESVMDRHSLEIDENDVYLCDDTEEDFTAALKFFLNGRDHHIDAVVCYNDRIAIGLWNAAHKAGYEIPRDFSLVGCDNSQEGQNIDPPLTTVTFPSYELGCAAITSLINIIQGRPPKNTTVFAEPVYAGSCGCSFHNDTPSFVYSQALQNRIADLENSMFVSMRMSSDFSHVSDIDDGMDILETYVEEIDGCEEFYLCLYSNWDSLSSHVLELTGASDNSEEDTDESTVLVKLAVRDGKRLPECSFSKTSLLPDFLQENSDAVYIVSPLFFEDRPFGYVAISFKNNQIDYHFKLVQWITNITQLLQNICEAKHTRALTEHLEDIYMKDVLTGLYNHHGFQHYEQILLDSAEEGDVIIAFLFDLDELKTINDNFGHKEGDFALQGIGQALKAASHEGDICARFSGDEFYCLIKGKDEQNAKDMLLRVDNYLENFNRLSSKPYNICASGGYACAAYHKDMHIEDIKALFSKADESMYKIKKSKEKHVLR